MISILFAGLLASASPLTAATNQWIGAAIGSNTLIPDDGGPTAKFGSPPAGTVSLSYTLILPKYSAVAMNVSKSSSEYLTPRNPNFQSINVGLGGGWSSPKFAGVAYAAIGVARFSPGLYCADCGPRKPAYVPHFQIRSELLGFPVKNIGFGPFGALNFTIVPKYYSFGLLSAYRW